MHYLHAFWEKYKLYIIFIIACLIGLAIYFWGIKWLTIENVSSELPPLNLSYQLLP